MKDNSPPPEMPAIVSCNVLFQDKNDLHLILNSVDHFIADLERKEPVFSGAILAAARKTKTEYLRIRKELRAIVNASALLLP